MHNQLTTPLGLTVAALLALSAVPGHADEAATRAASEFELSMAVATASRQWRDAFNAGDAAGAAAMYEEDAVMVAEPFGTFEGREAIQAFWTQLVEGGFDDVVYFNTTTVVAQDLETAVVSAEWRMNKAHGIITKELWALQPDGTALLREDHFEVAQ
ncbi:nuclear transport factor 2 family protein [uncultured Roseobacter sp.]|uniref:YybH family protein n=1 Tax=uncultured Roseobacter sp. TaxID=114847 RepID=UPI0026278623|nr:nuclear transport factor 2 family protein [uncultured Roseobacter sp.]